VPALGVVLLGERFGDSDEGVLGFFGRVGDVTVALRAFTRVTRPEETVVIDTFMPTLSFAGELRLPFRVTCVPFEMRNSRVLSDERNLNTIVPSDTDAIVPPYTPARASDDIETTTTTANNHAGAADLFIIGLTKKML
jgi:hypothetical protein